MKCVPVSLVVVWLCVATSWLHAEPLSYYLPGDITYDESIPTPRQHFGFSIGDRHLLHHQLVSYLQRLERLSPRITSQRYGQTYGHRPLMAFTITSPKNQQHLEAIRKQHRKLTKPGQAGAVDIEKLPAVINMGYSVHGDESSASNAVPLVAYHLAAAQGDQVEQQLEQLVILLDPCLNPDGFDRFANWANNYRGQNINADPAHIEHNQPWPGGRVNYYLFDLNRDWLPVQHPESQGRLRLFHQWKPNVLLDFHEMSTSSTFFFQPGIPQRKNPLIPEKNVELTTKIGNYHARALDNIGSLYYTEERYDDFYMGKGSTYPDLHGAIGILFEQASSRGHVQESPHGELTFAFTIRNQVTTSLSSLQATHEMRKGLLEWQREFYRQALAKARKSDVLFHAFSAGADVARLKSFATILRRHDIRFFWLTGDLVHQDQILPAGRTIVVPVVQPEYQFMTALFERRTEFKENVFYDVSTWTLPLAFDLDEYQIDQEIDKTLLSSAPPQAAGLDSNPQTYAFAIDWRSHSAAAHLQKLLARDVKAYVAGRPFQAESNGELIQFDPGTVLIPLGIQADQRETVHRLLASAARDDVTVHALKTGLTPAGIDLGSGDFRLVEQPRVLLAVDGGVARYAAGQVWHLLDAKINMPVTLVAQDRLSQADLTRYNTIILPSGSYRALSDTAIERLNRWISSGGTLVAMGSAVSWVAAKKIVNVQLKSASGEEDEKPKDQDQEEPKPIQKPYSSARGEQALDLISGAIFATNVDRTHPIGFGFTDDSLPVFRNNRVMMMPAKNPYTNPVVYTEQPLLSGYCSQENQELLSRTACAVVRSRGRGRVVLITDSPNFRAFWYGSSRLLTNAVFFGSSIREP